MELREEGGSRDPLMSLKLHPKSNCLRLYLENLQLWEILHFHRGQIIIRFKGVYMLLIKESKPAP